MAGAVGGEEGVGRGVERLECHVRLEDINSKVLDLLESFVVLGARRTAFAKLSGRGSRSF